MQQYLCCTIGPEVFSIWCPMRRSISVSMQQKSQLTRQIEGIHDQDEIPGREEMRRIQTTEELIQARSRPQRSCWRFIASVGAAINQCI
eukprot:843192-Pelagomonas_calceolata.AAC.2